MFKFTLEYMSLSEPEIEVFVHIFNKPLIKQATESH